MVTENTVTIEDAKLVLRNFAGVEKTFNKAGERNFGVLLDSDIAERMAADGWVIKWFKVKEEGDEPQAWLQVKLHYGGRKPPTVVMISSRGRTHVGEDTAQILDWVDIATCDLIIRPYVWSVNGNSGVKAYVKSIFITIEEDELERKYADVEEASPNNGRFGYEDEE